MGSPTVKEAREKLQAAMRLVSDGIDGDGHYEHVVLTGLLVACVKILFSALDAEDEERRRHAERLVSIAALRNVSAGEHADEPLEAGP